MSDTPISLVPREPPRMRRKPRPDPPPTVKFMDAEETFLASQGKSKNTGRCHRRKQSTSKLLSDTLKRNNVEYFNFILNDETEREFWMMFITGKQVKRDAGGVPLLQEVEIDGEMRLMPVLEDVELSPVSAKMFLRMVEYKRGQPVNIDASKEDGKKIVVEFDLMGASPEFFRDTGKATGLIKG